MSEFTSCPPKPTISWTEVDFVTVYPRNAVFSWTGAVQSMRSEPFGVARAACFEQLARVFAICGASQILSDFPLSSGNMPVSPDESAPIVRFVRKIRHFPGQKTVLFLSHDVNGLPVSLTSYANFVVNEFFSVTVVNEMQVLLTTHESTNFPTWFFY